MDRVPAGESVYSGHAVDCAPAAPYRPATGRQATADVAPDGAAVPAGQGIASGPPRQNWLAGHGAAAVPSGP
jgi:hypothetical protein